MGDPPSTTTANGHRAANPVPLVVGADEQDALDVDVERWVSLAEAVLADEGRTGELTLTFVDAEDMADLNVEHMGHDGPTDVLSFPLDADDDVVMAGVPVLLGDVVVCPAVARDQSAEHAGTLDDELALLVVHGVLHVLGHDHAGDDDAALMRRRERELLGAHHWHGPVPTGFRQEQT